MPACAEAPPGERQPGAPTASSHSQLLALRAMCCVCRGVPVHEFDKWEVSTTFYAFGLYWGNPQAQNAKGHTLGHIKVRRGVAGRAPGAAVCVPASSACGVR